MLRAMKRSIRRGVARIVAELMFYTRLLAANRNAPEEVRVGGLTGHGRLLALGQIGHLGIRRRFVAMPSHCQRFHDARRFSIGSS